MAHDTHFLERLHRVDRGHTERALGMYRDPELVRAILARARIGEQVERIAIALEESQASPHLVVDRAGHFITCLGAGMSIGALPEVTRSQLDGVTARVGRERTAREMVEGLQDRSRRDLQRLIQKLWDRGSQVSTEDIVPLLAMAPLLAAPLHVEALRAAAVNFRLAQDLEAAKQSPAAQRDALEELWNRHWQVGHLALLGAAGTDHLTEEAAAKMDEEQGNLLLLLGTMGSLLPQAARVLWATGRRGVRLLPILKRHYLTHPHTPAIPPLGAAMVVVALGHTKLRGEVRKLLDRAVPSECENDAVREAENRVHDARRAIWLSTLDQPNARVDQLRQVLAEPLAAQPLSDDALMAIAIHVARDALEDSRGYQLLMSILPRLARARPEQLYLPSSHLARPELAFTLELGVALQKRTIENAWMLRPTTVRVDPRPGRNAPCSCGSGQKSKRCCAGGAQGLATTG